MEGVTAVYSPGSILASGLVVYAQGLTRALEQRGFMVRHVTHPEDMLHSNASRFVWCGLPIDDDAARSVVECISDASAATPQLIVPEWERHSPSELHEILDRLTARRLLIGLTNNSDVGLRLAECSTLWSPGVLPTPLDPQSMDQLPRPPTGNASVLRACYAGRVAPYKRVDLLVEYWRRCRLDRFASLTLFTLDYRELASLTLPPGVHLSPQVETDPISRYRNLANFDIYVSASAFEFGPIAALEAMSQGCVPILSAGPGHSHLATASQACMLFGTPDELTAHIAGLQQDRGRLLDASRKAVQYVHSKHSPAVIAAALCEVFSLW
jgi:hypothetical protein